MSTYDVDHSMGEQLYKTPNDYEIVKASQMEKDQMGWFYIIQSALYG